MYFEFTVTNLGIYHGKPIKNKMRENKTFKCVKLSMDHMKCTCLLAQEYNLWRQGYKKTVKKQKKKKKIPFMMMEIYRVVCVCISFFFSFSHLLHYFIVYSFNIFVNTMFINWIVLKKIEDRESMCDSFSHSFHSLSFYCSI